MKTNTKLPFLIGLQSRLTKMNDTTTSLLSQIKELEEGLGGVSPEEGKGYEKAFQTLPYWEWEKAMQERLSNSRSLLIDLLASSLIGLEDLKKQGIGRGSSGHLRSL